MAMKFSDNQDFIQMLKGKQAEILNMTSDGVQETQQFQRLLSLLKSARQKNEECDFKLILISKTDLANLVDDADVKVVSLFNNTTFLTNRKFVVDSTLSINNYDNSAFPVDNNEARRLFTSLSSNDMVVFLVTPDAIINYFIDEKDYGSGLFYSDISLKSYQEKKTIDKLVEVLEAYRIELRQLNTYQKFFVPKSQLRTLRIALGSSLTEQQFLKKYQQLLYNRPEDSFREDLRIFIKKNMRVIVRKESVLEDLDRLDIEMYDEAGRDLYFIEVKWIGDSIHADGNKMGVSYKPLPRIKYDAVVQVIGYIRQLLEQKENIKLGYLAVFDARKESLRDSGEGITVETLTENQKEYFSRFNKLKDFRVINENPR